MMTEPLSHQQAGGFSDAVPSYSEKKINATCLVPQNLKISQNLSEIEAGVEARGALKANASYN
jgi:hypothetical protein